MCLPDLILTFTSIHNPLLRKMTTLRTVTVTRYMQPLREGGSLSALAEADDGFKYVVKFKPALRTTAVLQNIEKDSCLAPFFLGNS